jgi:hypothetical protein
MRFLACGVFAIRYVLASNVVDVKEAPGTPYAVSKAAPLAIAGSGVNRFAPLSSSLSSVVIPAKAGIHNL